MPDEGTGAGLAALSAVQDVLLCPMPSLPGRWHGAVHKCFCFKALPQQEPLGGFEYFIFF